MEILMDKKDFKNLSRQFRRVAGNLLNSTDTYEAIRLAKQFLMFIDRDPVLSDFIAKQHSEDFDIEFIIRNKRYNEKYDVPIETNSEITFIYQLLKYSTERFERYDSVCSGYAFYSGATYADQIREFNREVVKLLVNHITDYLEGIAIDMGLDEKPNAKVLVQGNVGQLNFSESGNIEAHQINNQNDKKELLELAFDLIKLLRESDIDPDLKEDAVDFVEETVEVVEKDEVPKPSVLRRVKNALSSIRTTVDDVGILAIKIDDFLQALSKISS